MKQPQNKAAKALGYFLAGIIIFSIISAVITVCIGIVRVTGTDGEKGLFGDYEYITDTKTFANIDSLSVSGSYFPIQINAVNSKDVTVKRTHIPDYVKVSAEGGTLRIISEAEYFFPLFFSFGDSDSKIVIEVPRDMVFKRVELDTGSGSCSINGVSADTLSADTGSGSVDFQYVTAGSIVLESGSGSVTFNNTLAKLLKVDSGSGRVEYFGSVDGDVDIESGSGKVLMKLDGNIADYDISADSGSGGVWLNDSKVDDFTITHSSAERKGTIRVDSGSGRVSININ